MKIIEILGGMRVPVYNAEKPLFEIIKQRGEVNQSELNERELELARVMVVRGVLKKVNTIEGLKGRVLYKINEPEDAWRI